jgi:hypothetical protein
MTKNKLSHLGSGADIVGTLDDPYHDPDLGCTGNPTTCENFLICFCEEEQNRLRRNIRKDWKMGGNKHESN